MYNSQTTFGQQQEIIAATARQLLKQENCGPDFNGYLAMFSTVTAKELPGTLECEDVIIRNHELK